MNDEYHSDGDEWMTKIAKDNLHNAGYTADFEDVSYHDYQGTVMYTARNPDSNMWGYVSYSYGSCNLCGSTEDWTENEFREALSTVNEQEEKPSAHW